jgi:hypothetical protein
VRGRVYNTCRISPDREGTELPPGGVYPMDDMQDRGFGSSIEAEGTKLFVPLRGYRRRDSQGSVGSVGEDEPSVLGL